MSDTLRDLDDFASLWAEEPTPDQENELRAIAGRVSFRGLFLHYADLGLGVVIALAVIVALALQPAPATLAIGLLSAGAVLWSSWKRHVLRQIGSLLQTSSRTDLIELEIRRVTTELKRSLIGLWLAPPAMILFAMLAYSVKFGWSLSGFGQQMEAAFTSVAVGLPIIAAMLTVIVHQAQLVQRLRRQLRGLRRLRGEYQEEARLDRVALG